MAEDIRELLHGAAPRPAREPDFEHMWARGRRQRRFVQFAGVTGAVVLLVVTGVGLTQLATPGPGDVRVVDEPDAYEELPGRGQDFGRAETQGGVPYVGRIRVNEAVDGNDGGAGPGRDEVCVSVRVGPKGERSTAEGCAPLERRLANDQMVWAHSRASAHAAVVAWSPLEAERGVWELPDGDRPVQVFKAPDLPGSVFVIAVDTPPEEDSAIVLYEADGAQVDQLELTSGGSFGEEDLADPDGETVPVSDRWVTPDDRDAIQNERGEGTWVVGYFYPDDGALAGPDYADGLAPRWKRISDDVLDLDQEGQLREALGALVGPSPTTLFDAWSGSDLQLELETAEVEGTELILDFHTLRAPANGTTHGNIMRAQVEAIARHYYPEADSICVLEDGRPAIWLHDMLGCPSRELRQ